jgi:Cu2+-exporting ATPase
VNNIAARLGIKATANADPAQKLSYLDGLRHEGKRVLMVGDGLNDAPALSAAHVSMAPASAADISQCAADVVFRGDKLMPVALTLHIARSCEAIVRQNIFISLGYNLIAVPLAMMGGVTPLIAAVAMSASSLTVVLNALRLKRL